MALDRHTVTAPGAPPVIGPYSHAVRFGSLLFCSGQIPLACPPPVTGDPREGDPSSGELVGTTAAEQARQCLENLTAVCEAAGASLEHALRLTVYMTDLSMFAEVNDVYASFFGSNPPARVAVGVAALPKGAQVEIDAIVAMP
jgi:2-iminobutanoate/2-iminopropanoate deaminase